MDDIGACDKRKNDYSTIIWNEFFTSIASTESKSRKNFLQILHGNDPQYFINANSADYIETIKPYLKITSTPELKLPSEFTLFTKYVVDIFLF